METKLAWKGYSDEDVAELERICADYIEFISKNKIEREFARAAIEQAKAAGYRSLDEIYEARDTIGAGDTHAGALLAALCEGLPLTEALRRANRAAAAAVTVQGGQLTRDAWEAVQG